MAIDFLNSAAQNAVREKVSQFDGAGAASFKRFQEEKKQLDDERSAAITEHFPVRQGTNRLVDSDQDLKSKLIFLDEEQLDGVIEGAKKIGAKDEARLTAAAVREKRIRTGVANVEGQGVPSQLMGTLFRHFDPFNMQKLAGTKGQRAATNEAKEVYDRVMLRSEGFGIDNVLMNTVAGVGKIGSAISEFAALGPLTAAGSAAKVAKFASLSKKSQVTLKALRTGSKFAAVAALQVPDEGETLVDRASSVAGSAAAGAAFGTVGQLVPKGKFADLTTAKKIIRAIRAPAVATTVGGITYAKTKDVDTAVEAAVMILGFEAVGLMSKGMTLGKERVRNRFADDSVKAARKYNPELFKFKNNEVKDIIEKAATQFGEAGFNMKGTTVQQRAEAQSALLQKLSGDSTKWEAIMKARSINRTGVNVPKTQTNPPTARTGRDTGSKIGVLPVKSAANLNKETTPILASQPKIPTGTIQSPATFSQLSEASKSKTDTIKTNATDDAPQKPYTATYARMPLDRVAEDAANGVRLAQVEMNNRYSQNIDEVAADLGLTVEEFLTPPKPKTTKTKTIDTFASRAPNNFELSMSGKVKRGILQTAKGDREAYRKTVDAVDKFNITITPANEKRIASLSRQVANKIHTGKDKPLGEFGSAKFAMMEYDSRHGSNINSSFRAAEFNAIEGTDEARTELANAFTKAGITVHQLNTKTNISERVSDFLFEQDPDSRQQLKNLLTDKELQIANAFAEFISPQGYRGTLVRQRRFQIWDEVMRKANPILLKLNAKDQKTKTDIKEIASLERSLKLVVPPDVQALDAEDIDGIYRQGKAAMEQGQLAEWAETQTWGTKISYYMSAPEEVTLDNIDKSVPEQLEQLVNEMNDIKLTRDRETFTRKGKAVKNRKPLAHALISSTQRLAVSVAINDQMEAFWAEVKSTSPDLDTQLLVKRFTDSVRRKPVARSKAERVTDSAFRNWWRLRFVDPTNVGWFAVRQLGQNVTFGPPVLGLRNFAKGAIGNVYRTVKGDPDYAQFKADNWKIRFSEKHDIWKTMTLQDSGASTNLNHNLSMTLDIMGITPSVTDEWNRMFVSPLAYNLAKTELGKFEAARVKAELTGKSTKYSEDKLMAKLKVKSMHEQSQLQLESRLSNGQNDDFILDYTDGMVESINFRYKKSFRSGFEQTRTGRILAGPITFLRGTWEIAYQNGAKRVAAGMKAKDWSTIKAGAGTIFTFLLTSHLMGRAYEQLAGREAYDPISLFLANGIGLTPGVSSLVKETELIANTVETIAEEGVFSEEALAALSINTITGLELFNLIAISNSSAAFYESVNDVRGARAAKIVHKELMNEWGARTKISFPKAERTMYQKMAHFFWGGFEDPEEFRTKPPQLDF